MKIQKITIHSLIFVSFILLFSCASKKIAFFHNTYPSYSVKKYPVTEEISKENITASTEEKISESSLINTQAYVEPVRKTSKNISAVNEAKENLERPSHKHLNKEQKRKFRTELRKIKHQEKQTRADINLVLLIILAVILPPLAVFLVDGVSTPFWIDLVLTIIFFLPGVIYALLRIFK